MNAIVILSFKFVILNVKIIQNNSHQQISPEKHNPYNIKPRHLVWTPNDEEDDDEFSNEEEEDDVGLESEEQEDNFVCII